jgi:hypothetical protein
MNFADRPEPINRDARGWLSWMVDVITDGGRGLRSLVRSVALCAAPQIVDCFHRHETSCCAVCPLRVYISSAPAPSVMRRCERLLNRVREELPCGRGDAAIGILRTLIAALNFKSDRCRNSMIFAQIRCLAQLLGCCLACEQSL